MVNAESAGKVPTLCHVTWQATNLERTRRFLERLFGWTFRDVGDNYLVFQPPSGAWVGLAEVPDVRQGSSFLPQIAVEDLSIFVTTAASLDPNPIVEEGEIPGVARYVDLRDPDGALFSVLQFHRRSTT